MVLKTKLHPMNTISLAPLLVQVRQDGGRMCALASSADQLGLQENCTGSSVLGSEEQPFKALHHECHWAVVIQAGCSYFFGHRNDGGLLEARGYKDSYHCENWHQFVSRQYEDPPTDTILLVPWCFVFFLTSYSERLIGVKGAPTPTSALSVFFLLAANGLTTSIKVVQLTCQ